ncbi:hypothetical protein [Candidatus Lokiarchaeum ossiferum]|uniref:hypothetical protein n=1 Tax=Candidatus Lokiarchaeum ossiferum TaxID=2951803 RepID=UPI00352FDCAC
MAAYNMPYFILSRKFGICSERFHNTAYSESEHLSDEALLELLKIQAPEYSQYHFVYYNHRPLTHLKWINLLKLAGFTVSDSHQLHVSNFCKRFESDLAVTLSPKPMMAASNQGTSYYLSDVKQIDR